MIQVEPHTARVCPECGKQLTEDANTFHCAEHGDFFGYGPQLLVHCASESYHSPIPRLLPWERLNERAR